MKVFFMLLVLSFVLVFPSAKADVDSGKSLTGSVSDPFVEAQEKLMYAKGNYKTVKMQERAIKDMRKATRLSLKASNLRAKAERLQNTADALIGKANQHAISRGLYITNPMAPVKMQPPPEAIEQTAKVPIPGQPINIILPKQEEVSLKQNESSSNDGYIQSPPFLNNF